MNLIDMVFYQKLQGSKRCPRAEAMTSYVMDDFFSAFDPSTFAREVIDVSSNYLTTNFFQHFSLDAFAEEQS